ncbi:tyrosine-type recombinase/integrase [Actinomadura nitritigenes]|uniref:tyrosine-type recombinase/integrase n=1 Tax=Actinomadura nitritigenes TaxID=134602 RepID=UPI003D8E527D
MRRRDAYGGRYRDSGYAFTDRNGDPISPGWLTHFFQRLIAAYGVPPIRLHDLRHGAATLALAAGVELKVVQEMLGHSSIVLTADTYTSVLPEAAHTAAEKTDFYAARCRRVPVRFGTVEPKTSRHEPSVISPATKSRWRPCGLPRRSACSRIHGFQ